MFDRETILEEASYLNLRPDILEKTYRLLQVLEAVCTSKILSGALALKGGTALNLFFGDPKRMSVDLDFNYIGEVKREQALQQRPIVEQELRRITETLSYRIQPAPDSHAGVKMHFNYTNVIRAPDRIEVDISYTNRVPLLRPDRRRPWTPKHITNSPALVCSKEELVAGKMKALIDRVAARDVFDAAWVMELIPADEFHLFKRLFILFGSTLPKPLDQYSPDRVHDITEEDVETRLLPMMKLDAKIDREQLIAKAKSAVEPLLQLDESEKEFCSRIDHGEYLPELLLSQWPEVMEPLREHPALLWKAENARKHRS